jgi:hypothetical protein
MGTAWIAAVIAQTLACAPVRRSAIDRGGVASSTTADPNAANGIDQCPTLVVKTDGGSANLFKMPAANGTVMYTVVPGTQLNRFPQNGSGTAEFPQISFQGTDGAIIGGKEDSKSLFVNRNSISCAPVGALVKPLDGAASNSQQSANSPATTGEKFTSPASTSTVSPVAPQLPAAPRPPTSTCKVDVPWHQKLWGKPECTAKDGKKITLERQTSVTIRQNPEPGTTIRYLDISRYCTFPEDNIDSATCSPKLPIPSK